ncbi:MAG: glycosyltransferase [Alphaproteobacteria bacterium]
MRDETRGNIAVILKGYPRLSETFIAQELLALEKSGLRLTIFSLRHPTDKSHHPVHDDIAAPVTYLPEYLHHEPGRVFRGLLRAALLPGFIGALRLFARDLFRDRTRNRIRRFGQSLILAAELPAEVGHIYAHFIHTPASVARYGATMRKLPWSCSAHAKDIWTIPDWEITEKLASAAWAVTCTRTGADQLTSLANDPDRVTLAYHGLDLKRFPMPDGPASIRDGSRADDPVQLLSVGRAVEKKGLDLLIDALGTLPGAVHWHWTHIGGGPLLDDLRDQVRQLGLADRVSFSGALPQTDVLAAYRAADLFVLPCRIASDGDRDGLPNVLVEAQSQGLACLSTTVAGVPELIVDGTNGILVPPDDRSILVTALARAIGDPASRRAMGQAGQTRVRRDFNNTREIAGLLQLFGINPGPVSEDQPGDPSAPAVMDNRAAGQDVVS